MKLLDNLVKNIAQERMTVYEKNRREGYDSCRIRNMDLLLLSNNDKEIGRFKTQDGIVRLKRLIRDLIKNLKLLIRETILCAILIILMFWPLVLVLGDYFFLVLILIIVWAIINAVILHRTDMLIKRAYTAYGIEEAILIAVDYRHIHKVDLDEPIF